VTGAAAVRDRHRGAVAVCRVADAATLCRWKAATPGQGASPVRGVWNGVGVSPAGPGATVAAETELALRPGRFQIAVTADTVAGAPTASGAGSVQLTLQAEGQTIGREVFPVTAPPLDRLITGSVVHGTGRLRLRAIVETLSPASDGGKPPTIWLSDLSIVALPTEEIKR
jgi:hypothetical protein